MLVTSGHAEETIADGKRVSLEYTLTLEDQTVFDTNVGKDPLVYTHGSKQIVPGLEKQLTGLQVGDALVGGTNLGRRGMVAQPFPHASP